MPLILAPSFDDKTREQVEEFIDMVRMRRMASAMEFQQSKRTKLDTEANALEGKLGRAWDQLGKCIARLDADILKAEAYLNTCEMLRSELGIVTEQIMLDKGE
jgi:hypothetical protein